MGRREVVRAVRGVRSCRSTPFTGAITSTWTAPFTFCHSMEVGLLTCRNHERRPRVDGAA
jgi:hypothetical protein